jgi:molybdenum cofactor biosynthesis enzyme MoaA
MNKHLNEKTEKTEKVIHLLVTTLCDRNCKYCCDKQYSFDEIPTVTDKELKEAEVICLTGGEPFKYSQPNEIAYNLKTRYKNIKAVYVYTNALEFAEYLFKYDNSIDFIDGVNVSIKTKRGLDFFNIYIKNDKRLKAKELSNILYVFDNLISKNSNIGNFRYKERNWQPDFKPADNSIFRRI